MRINRNNKKKTLPSDWQPVTQEQIDGFKDVEIVPIDEWISAVKRTKFKVISTVEFPTEGMVQIKYIDTNKK